MNTLRKIFDRANSVFVAAGCLALAAISLLTAAGITGRVLGTPLQGTYELTGFLCACSTGFGLELARSRGDNLTVDILFNKFHGRVKTVFLLVNDIMCALIFGFTSYFTLNYALTLIRVGELTETLRIPFYPFVICLCAGTFFVSLCYVVQVVDALTGKGDDNES